MTSFTRARVFGLFMVLIALNGCAYIPEQIQYVFDFDLNAEKAFLKAASASLKAADSNVLAYEQAMLATDVKDKTVTQAIKAYRISRQGGLQDQLETAYDTTAIIIESGVVDKISERANDPEFRRSWAEVKPFFDRSIGYFEASGKLQTYATAKLGNGVLLAGAEIFTLPKDDAAAKFKTTLLAVELIFQIKDIVPKLISNYEELSVLDEKLQSIPDYAQARKEREAAGGLTAEEIAEFDKEANLSVESGEVQFGSPFADEEPPVAATAPSQSIIDRKLDQHEYCAEVQTELKERGYYKGKIDGACGPLSREAIRGFKVDEGLEDNDKWTSKAAKILFGETGT